MDGERIGGWIENRWVDRWMGGQEMNGWMDG